jgi:hypothetical protein
MGGELNHRWTQMDGDKHVAPNGARCAFERARFLSRLLFVRRFEDVPLVVLYLELLEELRQ